jgi:hypothetical protein
MLSRIIVQSYQLLLEISMWVVLLGCFIAGWVFLGFLGAILGLIIGFIYCVMFFGAFLTLADIQKSVRAMETRPRASTVIHEEDVQPDQPVGAAP